MGWTITRHGTAYEVVDGEQRRESVLLADGVEVDRSTAEFWESSTVTDGSVTVDVRWGPRNRVVTCELRDADDSDDEDDDASPAITLVPPPGSRAAKREALAREHPVRFVLLRVAAAGAEIVVGVLGFGALVSAFFGQLVPRIDLSWVPRPDLPDLDAPDWLRYVDPFSWLDRLDLSWPDVSLPAWLTSVLASGKYWVPLVVAALIGVNELQKRRARDVRRDDVPPSGTDEGTPPQ